MSLEVVQWITDLDPNSPVGTEPKSQGDDHLRNIKKALKNSFKMALRPFSVPTAFGTSSDMTFLSAHDNTTVLVDTSGGARTLTLPALTANDAGWCIYIQKVSTDANPVFILPPPAGSINNFTKIRRSSEFHITKVVWNGGNFLASRPFGAPIGSCIEFYGTTLPNGHLWPDGTTFSAANFVELNTVLGTNVKPDRRGRAAFGKDDMGGSAASRVTNAGSGIVGTTLQAAGGAQNITLDTTMLPAHSHTITDKKHGHDLNIATPQGGSGSGLNTPSNIVTGTVQTGAVVQSFTGIIATDLSTGGGSPHPLMPPALIANFVLVAE